MVSESVYEFTSSWKHEITTSRYGYYSEAKLVWTGECLWLDSLPSCGDMWQRQLQVSGLKVGLKPAPKHRILIFVDCATHFCRRLGRVTQWQKVSGLRWMTVPDNFKIARSLSVSAVETHATDRALFLFIQVILRPFGNPKCTELTLRAFNSSFDYLCGSWYLEAAPPAIDERLTRMKARSVDAARSTYWHIRNHREPRWGQGRAVPAGLVQFSCSCEVCVNMSLYGVEVL
jgi:hypothetical protein